MRTLVLGATLVGAVLFASTLHAVTIRNVTKGVVLFNDDFEGVPGSPVGHADDAGIDDFDPTPNIGTWSFEEEDEISPGVFVEEPELVQVSSFSGTTTAANHWGEQLSYAPHIGSQYLMINREPNEFIGVQGLFDTSSIEAGDLIEIDMWVRLRESDSSSGGLGLLTILSSDDTSSDRLLSLQAEEQGKLEFNPHGPSGSQTFSRFVSSTISWVEDQWQLYEIQYEVGSTSITVSVDGVSETVNIANPAASTIGSIRIGNRVDMELLLDGRQVPEPNSLAVLASVVAMLGVPRRRP